MLTHKMCLSVVEDIRKELDGMFGRGERPVPWLVAYDTKNRRVVGKAWHEEFEEKAGNLAWLLRCATDCDAMFVTWQIMTALPEEIDGQVTFSLAEAEEMALSGHPAASLLQSAQQTAAIDMDRTTWCSVQGWRDHVQGSVLWAPAFDMAVDGSDASGIEFLDDVRIKFTHQTPIENAVESGHGLELYGESEHDIRCSQIALAVQTGFELEEAKLEIWVWPDQERLSMMARSEGAPEVFKMMEA